jgi:hypothetical protein
MAGSRAPGRLGSGGAGWGRAGTRFFFAPGSDQWCNLFAIWIRIAKWLEIGMTVPSPGPGKALR